MRALILKKLLTRDRHFYLNVPHAERERYMIDMKDTGAFADCGLALFSFLGGKPGKYSAAQQGVSVSRQDAPVVSAT